MWADWRRLTLIFLMDARLNCLVISGGFYVYDFWSQMWAD
jgi:hypothetical protein